ncbi:unnamed protein product [Mytilus edulis]|uniref:B box-type domain-containing protein n=1 Tax=Mytilus edulis TaxID=6550 RepID=A0A8S3RMS3_MYTED|nr:unnamed protein product [Mytilus edulis]
MSSKLAVCGVCDYQHINKASVVWCSECDEGLCEGCKVHHAASKGSRNHSIVLIYDYQNLPSNILQITQICPILGFSIYKSYYVSNQKLTKKHDTPCCRRCVVETHNDCKEIDALDDIIQNVKSSNAFLEIEQIMAELSKNLQRIRINRKENIRNLEENRTQIEKEVHQTRILINTHLDKLQESLMKELYAAEETESKKINHLISSIQKEEKDIADCQTTLDKIKQHASDLQTFLALKHIQLDVTNNERPGQRTSHIFFIEESQKLVVTSGNVNCIRVIDMKNKKTEKSINVGSQNYGIAHRDGKLFFNGYHGGLNVVSLDAMWSNNLYFINKDNSVSCSNLQGTLKWKLELKGFIECARGITVDNHGRVYVSGYSSHNVIVISLGETKHRLLLSKTDGLHFQQSLSFDRTNNQLLIANHRNDAFFYDVSK